MNERGKAEVEAKGVREQKKERSSGGKERREIQPVMLRPI